MHRASASTCPPLSPPERAEAERVIGRITGDGNPFDAWGNGNYAVNLPHAMSVVDKSDRIDSIVYCNDTSQRSALSAIPAACSRTWRCWRRPRARASKPYYLLSTRSGVMNRKQIDGVREARPRRDRRHAPGPWRARPRRPLSRSDHGRALARAPRHPERGAARRSHRRARRAINEFDAKRLLAGLRSCGHARTARRRRSAEAAAHAARRIGYPGGAQGRCPTPSRTRPSLGSSPSTLQC